MIYNQVCGDICFLESSDNSVPLSYRGGPKEKFDITHLSNGITTNDLEQVCYRERSYTSNGVILVTLMCQYWSYNHYQLQCYALNTMFVNVVHFRREGFWPRIHTKVTNWPPLASKDKPFNCLSVCQVSTIC